MKKIRILIASLFLIAGSVNICFSEDAPAPAEESAPVMTEFETSLQDSLEMYFETVKTDPIMVEYELLRDFPTGQSYPKFYAWVKLSTPDTLVEEGAIRLVSLSSKEFKVTHYLTREQISSEPENLYKIFPKVLADQIKERIKIK